MGKRAQSTLIEKFLMHVEDGLITGDPDSSGPGVLDRLCDALRAIQDGDKVDKSLGITRGPGNTENRLKFYIAALAHHWRERGENWATIQSMMTPFLEDNGHAPLSESRLKTIYSEKRADVERAVSIRRMSELHESLTDSE